MTDRPIIFSAPMIRVILREIAAPGTGKTQTRLVLKPRPRRTIFFDAKTAGLEQFREPAYRAGDRLWVREAWYAARSLDRTPPREIPRDADIEHAATARSYAEIGLKGRLRPGIHMPRWASRLTLHVTDVRVQRLQDISEDDARAEGIEHDQDRSRGNVIAWRDYLDRGGKCGTAIASFRSLWDSLNAERAPWSSNPWVVAVTFRPVLGNIGGEA